MLSKEEYFNHLNEIITDKIFVGNSIDDLQSEISNNMWTVSVNHDTCKNISRDDFIHFFDKVIENRRYQVKNFKNTLGMVFYLWFDNQACQLRFNLISNIHKKLPFGCKINIQNSLDIIIDEFLNSSYHNGIPVEELEDNDDNSKNQTDVTVYILNVYVVKIDGI